MKSGFTLFFSQSAIFTKIRSFLSKTLKMGSNQSNAIFYFCTKKVKYFNLKYYCVHTQLAKLIIVWKSFEIVQHHLLCIDQAFKSIVESHLMSIEFNVNIVWPNRKKANSIEILSFTWKSL